MTVGAAVVLGVSDALFAAGAVIAARRTLRQRKDRRTSQTIGTVGVALIFAGLALGLPAAVAHQAGSTGQVLDGVAVAMVAIGFVLFAAAKPAGYLEERAAARAQQAAGIPAQPALTPPWTVAVFDGGRHRHRGDGGVPRLGCSR